MWQLKLGEGVTNETSIKQSIRSIHAEFQESHHNLKVEFLKFASL
jgi:hypothetical protein